MDDAIIVAKKNDIKNLAMIRKEIDKLVYEIYGLTDSEIDIIEQSI